MFTGSTLFVFILSFGCCFHAFKGQLLNGEERLKDEGLIPTGVLPLHTDTDPDTAVLSRHPEHDFLPRLNRDGDEQTGDNDGSGDVDPPDVGVVPPGLKEGGGNEAKSTNIPSATQTTTKLAEATTYGQGNETRTTPKDSQNSTLYSTPGRVTTNSTAINESKITRQPSSTTLVTKQPTTLPSTTLHDITVKVVTKFTGSETRTFSGNSVDSASTNWVPILVPALTAGIVCLIIGYFLGWLKRRHDEQEDPDTQHVAGQDSGKTHSKHGHYSITQVENGSNKTSKPLMMEIDKLPAFESTPMTPITPVTPVTPTVETENENTPLTKPEDQNLSNFKAEKRQSPIDIKTSLTVKKDGMAVLKVIEEGKVTYTMSNTGTTVKVAPSECISTLQGGPLADRVYKLDHFHFHWGSKDDCGSEHTVDGQAYVAEIHFVHWDSSTFASFSEAASSKQSDALAVIGVLVKIGGEHHQMALITDNLSTMKFKGENVDLISEFSPQSLTPGNLDKYWSYSGSLTTPPYSENVSWIVLQQPIEISPSQMHEFRTLLSHERDEGHETESQGEFSKFISDNFRKVQVVGKRVVYTHGE